MNGRQPAQGDQLPTRSLAENPHRLVPGSVFANKYRILEKLGEDLFFAESTGDGKRKFLLRFVSSKELLENLKSLHEKAKSPYVCKLVDVIDAQRDDYQACLVFERGDKTLKEARQGFSNIFQKKGLLYRVFECLRFYHECDLVHCDICPLTVVYSDLDYDWKLQDIGTTVWKGQLPLPCRQSKYVAPETRFGAKPVGSPADMWSAGLLALGVLADMDLDDCCQPPEDIDDPSGFDMLIERIQGTHSKNLVTSLVQPDPIQRLSANRALEHEAFKTVEESPLTIEMPFLGVSQIDTRKGGIEEAVPLILKALEPRLQEAIEENIRQPIRELREEMPETIRREVTQPVVNEIQAVEENLKQPITELREELPETIREVTEPIVSEIQAVGKSINTIIRTKDTTYEEVCRLGFIAKIEVETLKCEADQQTDLGDIRDMEKEEPLKTADDYLPAEPIYLLRRGRSHRIRVSLTHKWQLRPGNFEIKQVSLTMPGGDEKSLKTIQTRMPSKGHEVVALFPQELFESLDPRSQCGLLEDKYVEIPVAIEVHRKANDKEPPVDLSGRIWCLPVSDSDILARAARLKRYTEEKWKSYPQWIRNAARGVVAIGKCAVKGAQATSKFPEPQSMWNLCECASILAVIFCGFLNKNSSWRS